MSSQPVFVGIDVSKKHLDFAIRPGQIRFRESNDDSGIQALIQRLSPLTPKLILLEATGGYMILAATLVYGYGDRLPRQSGHPRLLPSLAGGGQSKKLALTACMRKLLTILNAVLKHQQPWSPYTPINPCLLTQKLPHEGGGGN